MRHLGGNDKSMTEWRLVEGDGEDDSQVVYGVPSARTQTKKLGPETGYKMSSSVLDIEFEVSVCEIAT